MLILNLLVLIILNYYAGLYEIMIKGLDMFSLFQYMIAGVILWVCILLHLYAGNKGKMRVVAIWCAFLLLETANLGTVGRLYMPEFYCVDVDTANGEKIELVVSENCVAGAALGNFYWRKNDVLLKVIGGAYYKVDLKKSPMKNNSYTVDYDEQSKNIYFRYFISENQEDEIVFCAIR